MLTAKGDKEPFELLGTSEMEAIFAPIVIHNSKIMFETSLWDT